ncbi:MAG TPA: hypothetical protein VMQ62_13350 [Dongiaceae bacterium]|nr:hypothetical protein [Dongiaceae bacterium]
MRRALLAMALALATGIVFPSPGLAGPIVKRGGSTVGQFVTMAANAGDAATPVTTDEALRGLERLGIVVHDPEATLTQGSLAKIMAALGHPATTRDPVASAESSMIGAALGLLGSSPFNPLRGIAPDAFTSPTQPGGCLYGGVDCIQCCLRMHIPLDGCFRFCNLAVPSPSSPL